jgi:hypothetical protein
MGRQTEATDQTTAEYLEHALDAMAHEIKRRKRDLPWGA